MTSHPGPVGRRMGTCSHCDSIPVPKRFDWGHKVKVESTPPWSRRFCELQVSRILHQNRTPVTLFATNSEFSCRNSLRWGKLRSLNSVRMTRRLDYSKWDHIEVSIKMASDTFWTSWVVYIKLVYYVHKVWKYTPTFWYMHSTVS